MGKKIVLPEDTWIDVDSSRIKQINYDPDQRILGIRFKRDRVYYYHPVTQEGYLIFQEAESVGKHFEEYIKNNDRLSVYEDDSE